MKIPLNRQWLQGHTMHLFKVTVKCLCNLFRGIPIPNTKLERPHSKVPLQYQGIWCLHFCRINCKQTSKYLRTSISFLLSSIKYSYQRIFCPEITVWEMQSAEQTSEFHFMAFKNLTLAFEDDTASGCPMLENNPKCFTITGIITKCTLSGKKPLIVHSEVSHMLPVSLAIMELQVTTRKRV
jgi:hypothetical protein